MRVKVKSKIIPASFQKIEVKGRRGKVRWGKRPEKEERLVELGGDLNPDPEGTPKIKMERERKKQRDVTGRETARGTTEKSSHVKVIEREEVRGDDPIEYFLPTGVQKYLFSPRGGDGSLSPPKLRDFWRRKKYREKRSRFCYPSEKSEYEEHKH